MTLVSDYITSRKSARRIKVPNHPDQPVIEHKLFPIPIEKRGGSRPRRFDHFYPLEEMEVGDSFWVPADTTCTSGALTKFAKRTGWKFTYRAQTQDGKPNDRVRKDTNKRGTRVWRIG
jgi:hypothetical protein